VSILQSYSIILCTPTGEHSIAVYGIISRMLMFALFPILGITQGFIPIAGYNHGAQNYEGSRKVSKFLSNMQRC
jgi:Na+-driven multidrug efflux pump